MMNQQERTLKMRLENEPDVEFVFRKKNGELRTAHGTRNLDYIPLSHHPHEPEKPSGSSLAYFDHGKEEWRSFRYGSLLSICEGVMP